MQDQVQRASLSIPCNVAEGYERNSNKEFIRFLNIAKGSGGELRTQLYISRKLDFLKKGDFDRLVRSPKRSQPCFTAFLAPSANESLRRREARDLKPETRILNPFMNTPPLQNRRPITKSPTFRWPTWEKRNLDREKEMPGLIAIREKYARRSPRRCARDRFVAHEIQTAVLIETLVDLARACDGLRATFFRRKITPPPPSPDRGVRFAWKRRIARRIWWCTYQALSHSDSKGPQLVVDDGGDATLLIHKGYELEEGSDWRNPNRPTKKSRSSKTSCSKSCARIRTAGTKS